MSNVEKLAEALERHMELDACGEFKITADGVRAALSAAGLEVNKAGTFDALKVFGKYYSWACRNEWPTSIQVDDMTPIMGRVNWNGDRGFDSYEVYVRDFRTAHALTEGEG